MTQAPRTALVVMKPGRGGPGRAAETPTDPAVAGEVVSWFVDRGFDTGPVVGISFAVSGSEELFGEVFGQARRTSGGERAFGLDVLDARVRQHVQAVVEPRPPDFGPGNP